jgi:sugar lactone lactonase YvrE
MPPGGPAWSGEEEVVNNSDSNKKPAKPETLLERFRKSSFPPAAALGAFASFSTTAFGSGPDARAKSPQNKPLLKIDFAATPVSVAPAHYEIDYAPVLILGGTASEHAFRRSLIGIDVDSKDKIYVLGDGEVRTFEPDGKLIRSWKAPDGAACIHIGSAEQVYVGLAGRVEIYSATGVHKGGFAAEANGKPAGITAIRTWGQEILVADAAARKIRRYDRGGKQLGEIGTQSKTGGFMLPNRSLDIAVDANGIVFATDTGRHRVSSWVMDGSPAGHFGKFGLAKPEDFVGCCNPVNLAVGPDGKIITAEKVISRVKVFTRDGKLLGLIGPEHFDPKCIHLHLAVDSRGRILVADPVRMEIKAFSPSIQSENNRSV